MPLSYATREEIPEAIRDQFVKVGDRWVPDGYVPASTHEEMKRKANPERLAELEAATKGLDLKAAREALTEVERLRREAAAKAAGVEPERLDKLREEWTGQLRTDHEAALKAEHESREAAERKLADATAKLTRLEIEAGVVRAGSKLGLLPGAVADATGRGLDVWKRGDDGQLVARKPDGSPLYIDNKAATFETWLGSLRSDGAGHWFRAPASGSGASGNEGGGGAKLTRPHSDYDNMTPAEAVEFANQGGEFT